MQFYNHHANIVDNVGARKLRASFMTAMREMGYDYCDLQVYVGQSVGTVMSAHYDRPSAERLGKIAGLAEGMVGEKG